MSFLAELRRRNVVRVGLAYALAAWVLLQGADFFLDMADAPKWVIRVLFVLAGVGLPALLLFAWTFEITPEGLRREKQVHPSESIAAVTGKRLDRLIIVMLVVVSAYLAADKFFLSNWAPSPAASVTKGETGPAEAPSPVESKTIAVLPFIDMSPDGDQEYLSDGISNELLNLLARIPELRVTSRSTAFSYKGSSYRIADVGRELGVAHVLEGTVMKSGEKVRVSAQLIEVQSDSHLWSATYDRELDDIFAIQDEIANEVVSHLKITLLEETPSLTEIDPEAYALYLQAKELGREFTPESLAESNHLLQRALEIDPTYLEAKFALGTNKRRLASLDLDRQSRYFSVASGERAFSMPVSPSLVTRARGLPPWSRDRSRGDLEAMARSLEQALEESPDNWEALLGATQLAYDLGRLDDALLFSRWLVRQDPASVKAHSHMGHTLLALGRFDDALASYRYAREMNRDRIGASYDVGVALLLGGEPNKAMLAFAEETDKEYRLKGTAMALHAQGEKQAYEQALAQLMERLGDSWPRDVAEVNAWVGDADSAFDWLAREMQASGHLVGITADQMFSNLHGDPRWQPLLEEAGISEAQLEAIEFRVTPPEIN